MNYDRRIASPKQKLAGKRNFDKMRAKGAVATLLNMSMHWKTGGEHVPQLLALRQALWDAIDVEYASDSAKLKESENESQEST